jgi:uncharacterized protein (DUF305 family)
MTRPAHTPVRAALLALAASLTLAASRSAAQQAVEPQGASGMTPAERARLEIEHPTYTPAGVQFMSGMIGHHAQALAMTAWCPTHGASAALVALCGRITVSQADEIRFMQGWLRDRHLPVPPIDPRGYTMPGMDHPMLMPGMLTPEQMSELDRARGPLFGRLFLTDMIGHHEGALDMVHQLMTSTGQTEGDALVMYANNVAADQSAEIGRMQRMLAAMPRDGSAPDTVR